jgi:iron complex outermembrane receptor protein
MTRRIHIRGNQILALMATSSLMALAPAAFAQDSAKPAVNDDPTVVVVTSQKREQKLQEVPMAITVAGAAQLERQQITTVRDLDRVSPAVTFVDGAPGGGAGIRGIATQSFTPSAEASVGIVVDEVPQGNVNVSNLFDMERVEVLRGPQGTLFGQSASAGVINMVTKAPKIGDTSGRIHIDYADHGTAGSEYGERVVQGVLNLPIDDHSAVRVSGFYNNSNGYQRDAVTGDNQNTDMGFRVRYLNKLTDNLKLNIIADYDNQKYEGNHTFVFRATDNPTVVAALAACGIVASPENNVSCATYPNYDTFDNGGISAQLDYSLGDYTLTSITSARYRDFFSQLDVVSLRNDPSVLSPDGVYPQIYASGGRGKLRQTSQEFRITSPGGNKLDWVLGAYFARSTYNQAGSEPTHIVIPFSPCDTCAPIPGATETINQSGVANTASNTAALFANLTYDLTPKLTALAGIRLTHETVSDRELFSLSLDIPFGVGNVPVYTNVPATASTTEDNVSGRIGLQYKFSSTLMAYGTLSRGYKGPQINDTVFGVTPTIVRPEIPTAAELGVKGAIGRVGIDVNVFYTKVEDYQGQKCIFTPNLSCGGANVSEVISKGLEVDLFGKVFNSLTLNGGFIYNPVTYPDGYLGSDGTDLGGTQMTGAPKYKFNLSGEYVINLANDYKMFIGADTTYKSLIHIYPSTDTAFDVAAHWITGAKIGVKFPDGNTTLALYARNIGNTPDPVNIYPGPAGTGTQQIVGKQGLRVVGISLDKSF